jgi:hypothetical protein
LLPAYLSYKKYWRESFRLKLKSTRQELKTEQRNTGVQSQYYCNFCFAISLFIFYIVWYKSKQMHEKLEHKESVMSRHSGTQLHRLSLPNLNIWNPNSKTFWCDNPSGKFHTWCYMTGCNQNASALKMLYKITFRLCVWGVYKQWISCLNLGSITKDLIMYIRNLKISDPKYFQ